MSLVPNTYYMTHTYYVFYLTHLTIILENMIQISLAYIDNMIILFILRLIGKNLLHVDFPKVFFGWCCYFCIYLPGSSKLFTVNWGLWGRLIRTEANNLVDVEADLSLLAGIYIMFTTIYITAILSISAWVQQFASIIFFVKSISRKFFFCKSWFHEKMIKIENFLIPYSINKIIPQILCTGSTSTTACLSWSCHLTSSSQPNLSDCHAHDAY